MAAGIRVIENNRTYNVPVLRSAYTAIVGPFKRGKVDQYNSVSNVEDFIKKSTVGETVNVGDHVCYFDALSMLEHTTNFGFIRAANNALYGGAYLKSDTSSEANGAIEFGLSDPSIYDLMSKNGKPVLGPVAATIDLDTSTSLIKTNTAFFDATVTSDPVVFTLGSDTGTLPTEIIAGTTYYAIKPSGGTDQISIADSAENAVAGTAITFTGTMAQASVTNLNLASEENADLKCLLLTDRDPGQFNVSVKIYPYRYEEVITEFTNGSIGTAQKWGDGEVIRFTTTGTLPTGLESYINYYTAVKDDGTIGLCQSFSDATNPTKTFIEFGEDYQGRVKLINADNKCPEPGCFAIEVYTDKSRTTPAETLICSRTPGKLDGFGINTYITEVMKGSFYLGAVDNLSVDPSVLPKAQITHLFFDKGSFGDPVTDSAMIRAAQCLRNSTEVTVTFISDGGWTTTAFQNELVNICETRRDCMTFLSVPYSVTISPYAIDDMIDYRQGFTDKDGGIMSSRFGALYSPWVKITDGFNDREIAIPMSGQVIGQICKNALNSRMWRVPAGYKGGKLSVNGLTTAISYTNDGGGDIDRLDRMQINPVIKQRSGSIEIWGNNTLEATVSDTSYVHASLALIVIQPAIIQALRDNFTWEFKTQDVYDDVEAMLSAYLETMQADLAIQGFKVVCNAENNTEADNRAKRLVVDVALILMDFVKEIWFRNTITRDLNNIVSVSTARI